MPKNLVQSIVFGVLMVVVMVYFMICYNIAMDMGGLTPSVFILALGELPIMAAIAFVLESVALGKLAKILAFRIVNPATDKPMAIILAISAMTVCCMCPVMSFIATLMHSGTQSLFTNWLQRRSLKVINTQKRIGTKSNAFFHFNYYMISKFHFLILINHYSY